LKDLLQQKSKQKSLNYYKSIEVYPIWNFNKVMETGNPIYVYMLSDYFDLPKLSKKQMSNAVKYWDELFDQYLKRFGLSESSYRIIKTEISIAKMKAKMVERSDWGMSAAIRIEESKLRKVLSEENKSTLEETVAFLEDKRKISIDQFKCSVVMFYTYVNLMNKQAKKNKAAA
jgi:hypothetical protein